MKRIYYFNTVVINLIKSKSDTLLEYFVVVIVKLRQGSGKERQGKARKGKDGER